MHPLSFNVEQMHRALFVSEVLLEIFINLNQLPTTEGWTQSLTQRSLAALARTCKTFHEPAMDLLWANMPGLRPLLGCVTRLHSMIYDPETKYSWSQCVDPLAEHEFHEFLRHSARVRSMTISSNTYFRLLTALPIETCVFPGLISLSWMVQRTNIGDLHFFLSPTLLNCSVSEFHSDLTHIGTRCAALEAITLLEDSGTVQLSATVRSCKRLKYLECPPLDSAAWMHLSTVPTLLKVKIVASRIIHFPLDNLNFATFLNLTTLCFRRMEVAAVVTIMQHFEFPSLKEFEMHVRVLPWAEAEQLCRALSQCKANQTLEHICISSRDRIPQHSGDPLTAVRQFLCFTQLRTLRLSTHCFIYLDDDLLLEAMTSWPYIRSLSLDDWHICPPTVTFRGLIAALRLCPYLQYLQVPVDFRNIDIGPEAKLFQNTSLQNLTIASSEPKETDSEAVARIIYSVLPAVEQVMRGNGNVRLWNNVNRHLELLRNKSSSASGHFITGAASQT
ncbi:hypothetical protein DEU56DRAFT_825168 [Suillus clintonianus]|uniref:uncharacterized protein n=1 Tax=Suillus clintonianus TaxID=1904413 RepID=UPI001B86E2BE|nr:uncharacterized protein DEU56DRAFT_825168 [Suillus clintonianus]KAG2125452.1 hypothetical protein DEU56DRAFT_825168 [Suillus clintonianus]